MLDHKEIKIGTTSPRAKFPNAMGDAGEGKENPERRNFV